MAARRAIVPLFCILACGAANVAHPAPAQAAQAKLSSTAERVFAAARPRLLQIRTVLAAGGRQSTIGSGFLVSRSGLAITNYHVVSQYALEPESYRLEYTAADGRRGPLELLAFDIVNDVALVRMDKPGRSFFEFDTRVLHADPPRGERLYSMGNPLDLGFSIVEGTYNGPVARSYNERILFSGAINPGMSGGPAVSAASRIVGVNVAKRMDGELVSFLVPAHFAADLVAHAGEARDLSPEAVRTEIARQITAWQAQLYKAIGERPFGSTALGPYRAPEPPSAWFSCWAYTNANRVPRPRGDVNVSGCGTNTSLFVANDLSTGRIYLTHTYVRSVDLNDFQFASFLSQYYRPTNSAWNPKRYTHTHCYDSFVAADPAGRPALRAAWCTRAYREFEGLYDVTVLAVTQNSASEALVTRLTMQGASYESALQLGRRILQEVRLAR
jgi:serine protease Do